MNLAQYLRRQLTKIDEVEGDCAETEYFDHDIADGWQSMLDRCAGKAAEAGNAEAYKALNVKATTQHHAREAIAKAIGTINENLDGPLTVAQAAERFNLSKRTIYRMVDDGLPHSRARNTIRIKPVDLTEYLETRNSEEILFD